MDIVIDKLVGYHPAARPGADPAIKNISFSIASGEQVAIIGPSGAGKTTALQLLSCALKPHSGQLKLAGLDPWALTGKSLQKFRSRLFVAPQVPPLPPRQRVITSVLAGKLPHMTLFQSLRSLFYPIDIAGARSALADFDLADKLFDRVDRLSGGERQRVGLARGLVSDAELLFVDEPLSALDPARAELAMTTLTVRAKQRGATLVATLHQVDMAIKYFPRVIGLREGELAFDLPASEVTSAILTKLYEQHLDELTGPAPEPDFAPDTPKPVIMQCR